MRLTAKNLSLSFGGQVIFKNLSFSAESGEILAIKGPNGSGKSSLCLCLAGLMEEGDETAVSGEVYYGGKALPEMGIAERCACVGIVFQNPDMQLFSPIVTEELAFAPENLALPRDEIKARIEEAAGICGIKHLLGAKTNRLSGGEKQLVAIASTLTMKPKFLIADEITSRIDTDKKDIVRNILINFAKEGGGVIMVSHNPKDLEIAHRVIELKRGKDYEDRSK